MKIYLLNWHVVLIDIFIFALFMVVSTLVDGALIGLLKFAGIWIHLVEGIIGLLVLVVFLVAAFRTCNVINRGLVRYPRDVG